MSRSLDWPSVFEEQEFHRRLLSGDRTVPNEIARRFLELLTRDLQRRYPRGASDLVTTAAIDALMSYLKKPESFNASLGTLGGFLRLSARRDLLNALPRTELQRRTNSLDSVAEMAEARNQDCEDDWREDHPELSAQYEALTPPEKATFDLMYDGYFHTADFVVPLGIEESTVADQEAAVKRTKDRIQKRFQRAMEKRK